MKQRKHRNLMVELAVIVASILALMLLVYFVMVVSFQNGASSMSITMQLAERVTTAVFDDPGQEQIKTVSLMIRYEAHLALFFVVGLVTAFVSMVIFRGYFRIMGVLLSGVACYLMAYYTEYFKQYIDGRHFQMTDVQLNWYGGLAGIACMVISYFMNRLLVKLSG